MWRPDFVANLGWFDWCGFLKKCSPGYLKQPRRARCFFQKIWFVVSQNLGADYNASDPILDFLRIVAPSVETCFEHSHFHWVSKSASASNKHWFFHLFGTKTPRISVVFNLRKLFDKIHFYFSSLFREFRQQKFAQSTFTCYFHPMICTMVVWKQPTFFPNELGVNLDYVLSRTLFRVGLMDLMIAW